MIKALVILPALMTAVNAVTSRRLLGGTIPVFVQCSGQIIGIDVKDDATVRDTIQAAAQAIGLNPDLFNLHHAGRRLTPDELLCSEGVGAEAHLELVSSVAEYLRKETFDRNFDFIQVVFQKEETSIHIHIEYWKGPEQVGETTISVRDSGRDFKEIRTTFGQMMEEQGWIIANGFDEPEYAEYEKEWEDCKFQ